MRIEQKHLYIIIIILLVTLLILAIGILYYAYQYDYAVYKLKDLAENCVYLPKYGGETTWNMTLGLG